MSVNGVAVCLRGGGRQPHFRASAGLNVNRAIYGRVVFCQKGPWQTLGLFFLNGRM